jgi:hypothetical protein
MTSEQSKLFTWLLENLRPANNQECVYLFEIKSKCNLSATISAVENLIVRLFKDVKIKQTGINLLRDTMEFHCVTTAMKTYNLII